MNLFSELFQKRRAFLKRVVKEKERAFRKAPEGRIRISLRDSGIQYYRVLGEDNHAGSYIRRRDKKLIIALVQKDYDQRVLKQAKKELDDLQEEYDSACDDVRDFLYANLKLMDADVLDWKYCNGKSVKEIAEIRNITYSGAANRISRAEARARSKYAKTVGN